MVRRRRCMASLAAALLGATLTGGAAAAGQGLPRSVTVASNPPGSVFYALASGLAKVVTEATPMQMTVQPYTGTSTFLPLLNGGELDFGVNNAVDMALAYQGPGRLKIGGRNPFAHTPNVRLAMRGSPLLVGLLVRRDSPIKSIQEIRGKRVTGEYPAQLAVWYNMLGLLSSAGLTWNDIKVVPVPAVNEGVDALIHGRADVSQSAINSAKVREADATVGIRHISIDCSPQGEERLRKAVPGYYPRWVKAGGAVGVLEDTCFIAYDIYLTTHRGAADAVVAAALQAVWDGIQKLPGFHPTFREWTRQRAVDPEVTLPYHPAAVQFYKERGAWSARMDEVQRALLAVNP